MSEQSHLNSGCSEAIGGAVSECLHLVQSGGVKGSRRSGTE